MNNSSVAHNGCFSWDGCICHKDDCILLDYLYINHDWGMHACTWDTCFVMCVASCSRLIRGGPSGPYLARNP